MNPWLTKDLAAARVDDWRRLASSRHQDLPRTPTGRTSQVDAARLWLAALLIDAGRRVGGPEVVMRARRVGPPGPRLA